MTRNRRHLRRIPGKKVEVEEEEEDNDTEEQLPVLPAPAPAPVLAPVPVPVLAPAPIQVPAEVQHEGPVPVTEQEPDQEEPLAPRRSSRERGLPDRLVVTGNGKFYGDTVHHNLATCPMGSNVLSYVL